MKFMLTMLYVSSLNMKQKTKAINFGEYSQFESFWKDKNAAHSGYVDPAALGTKIISTFILRTSHN